MLYNSTLPHSVSDTKYSIANTSASLAGPVIHAPTPMQSRRGQRYTRSEEALAKSLKRCKPEPSAQELQIRALEQVTAILSARAKDAQERAAKLRGAMSDKHTETDPQTFATMQRERWMEEKRKSVVDSEAKVVREQIVSLSRFGGKIKTIKRAEAQSKMTSEETRRQANLAKFFELSPTRKPISSRKRSSPSSYDRAPRRVTMNDAPPMLLRTSIMSTFTPYTPGHARSISLDAKLGNRSSTASSRYQGNSSLAAVAEDADTGLERSIVTIPPAVQVSETQPSISIPSEAEPMPTITHVPAPISKSQPKPQPSVIPSSSSPSSGFVTIFAPATLRSKADILAGMADIEAELPGYAVDLIGDLDGIHDHISLRPTTTTSPPASNETTTPSRHKSPKPRSFQEWSHSPSILLRKSRSTSPTKIASRTPSLPHSPLSNLFSISETVSTTTAIPIPIPNPKPSSSTHDSMLSFPFPHGRSEDVAATIPRTSTSTTGSSFEIIHTSPHMPHPDVQSSPSKLLRQRFAFIGRK
jgi:hypothetical protein